MKRHCRRLPPASVTVPLALATVLAALPAGAVEVVEASIAGGELVSTVVVHVVEQREEVRQVNVNDNGRNQVVEQVVVVNVKRPELMQRTTPLDSVWATDAAGKEIPRDKLVELLRKPTLVVTGDIPAERRAIFRAGTLFLEIAEGGGAAGGEPPPPAPPGL